MLVLTLWSTISGVGLLAWGLGAFLKRQYRKEYFWHVLGGIGAGSLGIAAGLHFIPNLRG